MSKPVVVLGAGGHAAVVADLLSANGVNVRGVVTPTQEPGLPGIPWLGDSPPAAAEVELVNGIGAADPDGAQHRAREFERYVELGYDFPHLIHPRAIVARDVTIEPGAQVMAGVVLQAQTTIGQNVIVNTGALIDHHGRIEDHAHIAPGAVLCGGVTVGRGAIIGAGAVVLPGASVTAGTLVKAASRYPN